MSFKDINNDAKPRDYYRISIGNTQVLYLKAQMTFSAGSPKAYGTITARCVR
jgi:hypothetical protein